MPASRSLYRELARTLGVHDAPQPLVLSICGDLAADNPRFSGTKFREAVDDARPKPYACPFCTKDFRTEEEVNDHLDKCDPAAVVGEVWR